MIRLECKRAFCSRAFLLSLALGSILAIWHIVGSVWQMGVWMREIEYAMDGKANGFLYPHTVFNKWMGGDPTSLQPYLYFLIFPILAALPYGASYAEDEKSGYARLLLVRSSRGSYYGSKALAVFLSGGTAVVLPLLLNLGITAAILPSLVPQAVTFLYPIHSASLWSELYYSHPYLYIALFLLLIFIFGGLFALLALPVSRFTNNRFLILLFPFLIYVFSHALAGYFQASRFSPMMFLRPNQPAEGISLPVIAGEALILFGIPAVFLWKRTGEDVF